jgi:hypothetical protein
MGTGIPRARFGARLPKDLHDLLWKISIETMVSMNQLVSDAVREKYSSYQSIYSIKRDPADQTKSVVP